MCYKSCLSYNIHVCNHLADYVLQYGPRDDFSSFPFENFLGILKRRVKPSSNVFQQSLIRKLEIRTVYHQSESRSYHFTTDAPNNCGMLMDGRIVVLITSITGNFVSGQILKFARNLCTYPYDSCFLKLGYYSRSRDFVKNVCPIGKCVIIYKTNEYIIPLV